MNFFPKSLFPQPAYPQAGAIPSSRLSQPVDPRIEARRQAVAEEKRSRRAGRAFTVLIVLALVGAAFGAARSSLLDVDEVAVRGAQQVSAEELVALAGIVPGDALIGLDLEAAREAVAAHPWIEDVEVAQYMSGEVVLSVTEREPAAAILSDDDAVLIDEAGRVLAVQPAESLQTSARLLAIGGLQLDATPGHWVDDPTLDLVQAVAGLPPEIAGATWGLEMAERGLELYLGSSIGRVILGDVRDLDAKVWAIRSFATSVNMTCVDALDVRAPSVPVLTFRDGCS